ncbi:fatty acid hydroxylase [Flammeovirgaceae bacterium 311]|nr:fatty acid hydroxylase [Flammeovirgaceae bacterium 311]
MDQIILYIDKLESYSIMPYAVPVLLSLVVVEWIISTRKKIKIYDPKDSAAATVIGLTNVGIGLLLKTINFTFLLFFFTLIPWRIPTEWWTFVLCFIAIDFFRYWAHRIAHEQRFWWATHVTHHSSKEYNFTVSFRLGWTQYIKIIFFVPVILMGFDPIVFFLCHQIAVLYQFWIHSPIIKRLPAPIEFIFVTPSNHRVHHGTNPQYIDKNYGSTFIIWDRLFGTFEPEGEQVVYGITKPIKHPYNPIYLNFHEWIDIWSDLKKSKTFKERWDILFGPPGGPVLETVPLPKEKGNGNSKITPSAAKPAA